MRGANAILFLPKGCQFQKRLRAYGLDPRKVVLNLFYISYPFFKQNHEIYLQYTQWCSFIENMKLTNSYSLKLFIKIYNGWNLSLSKLNPLEDEIYPLG